MSHQKNEIRQLLRKGGSGCLIVSDVLEESGWDPDLVAFVAEHLAEGHPPGDFVVRVLGELAKTDYPAAIRAHLALSDESRTGDPYRSRDYGIQYKAIQAMNSAECGPDWEAKLEHEKMLQVAMVDGDLDPWEVINADGEKSVRKWAVDFAPEWLDDLDTDSGSFKTVWYSDGGNFGPSFDEVLRDEQGTWRSIHQFAAGAEPECPHRSGAPEDEEVTLEQTYCGDSPGRECALCGERVGDAHGVIYMGELGGAVFKLDQMAGVTDIEIREMNVSAGAYYRWEVLLFAGDDEVELDGFDNRFETQEEAENAARAIPGSSGKRFVVIPLEDE